MLMKVLLAVVGLLILFVAIAATRPSGYRVERRLEVSASTDDLFAVVNDLHRFEGVLVLFGEAWNTLDPAMQKSFDGPAAGVGQSFAWTSKKDAGVGKMTIEESVPGQRVRIRLDFAKPMKSTSLSTLTFTPTSSGTAVTWLMEGKHNFVGKAFSVFMNMDKMLGADLEKGLARLEGAVKGQS